MESINSDAHTHVEPEPSSVIPSNGPAPLNIRWGRTLVALVGLLGLLTAGISGALNVFNIGSAPLAWAGLAIFLAVLAGLRSLAVRDQNLRRAASFNAAHTTADEDSAAPASSAGEQPETTLFDGAAGGTAEVASTVQKPLTAEELRTAALRVAAKGTADAKLAHTQTLAEGESETETWEPVEVPVPAYVTAARAASQTTALIVPEVPKSAGTSIKADQAGVGAPTTAPVVIDGGKSASPANRAVAAKVAKPNHALNNLDDVLQRRRA
ncbi:hypothetical protein [Arthrobacter sp. GMC3]|uniref:hypothetical protein n=1 Tax=Arthrobacter sp. GMC3 TaxID=2058894 RepID=UPI0011B03BA3|nr:hypothetical protein [Arthrobacter sp. GMC3]